MNDEMWAWVLRIGGPLVTAAVLGLVGWGVKRLTDKTLLGKVLAQLGAVFQGFASDVTGGMGAAISDAVADGRVTAEERQRLIAKLVVEVKQSASARLLSQVQTLLGIQPGSAFDGWLRGMAGEHIDSQLASALPALRPVARYSSTAPTPVLGTPVQNP